MIVDALLGMLFAILGPVVDALPTGSLPSGVLSGVNVVRGWIWGLDAIVPVGAPFAFAVSMVLVGAPAFVVFRVGVFIFDKIRGAG